MFHYWNCVGLLSYYETLKGHYDEVEAMFEESIKMLIETKNYAELTYRYAMIGEISIWYGDFEQARKRFAKSNEACLKVQYVQKIIDNHVLLGLIAFLEKNYAELQNHLNDINVLVERLGLSYSSVKDAYALKVRLNLVQNKPDEARDDLLKLLRFSLTSTNSSTNFVDFTCIAAADWLIYQGQAEQVNHMLHFVRYSDVPPAVRKCAQDLIESLPEHDEIREIANFDMQTFLQELQADLEN
jgi:tetratricopeptide (TPR) repeat protein